MTRRDGRSTVVDSGDGARDEAHEEPRDPMWTRPDADGYITITSGMMNSPIAKAIAEHLAHSQVRDFVASTMNAIDEGVGNDWNAVMAARADERQAIERRARR